MPTPKLIELDESVTVQQQSKLEVGPAVLINTFHVKPEEVDRYLAAWQAETAYLKRQPGHVSSQLHRGIGGSHVFVNYAIWECAADHGRAVSKPEAAETREGYPPGVIMSPHMFQKVAVPGICVA